MPFKHLITKTISLSGRKRRLSRLCLVLLLSVSGCATGVTQGDLAPVSQASSRLIIYRPSAFVGIATRPMISVNGVDECRIANGAAFTLDLPPGNVTITSSQFGAFGTSSLAFTAAAGQVYYVRFTMDSGQTWAGVVGGVVGQVVAQAVSKHAGPFDMELTDQAAMGSIIPGHCDV